MGCDGQFEQSCRWILNPVCYFPNSTSLQSKMLLTLTTSSKLVRRGVKDSLIWRFRLKSNGLVFHKLLINIKQGSDSWRELFLGPCVGFQARAGRAGESATCRFVKEQLLWTCLNVASVETLTNATCGTMNIQQTDEW